MQSKIEFYKQERFVNDPFHPAGFKGTWNFSDHTLIPDVFHEFLQRHFSQFRIRRIPLDKINQLLNEIWEGPGSLEKVFLLEQELRANGKDIKFTAADIAGIKAKKYEEDEPDNDDFVDLDNVEDFDSD